MEDITTTCRICKNATANNHNHYGSNSVCHSCRAFFMRSVKRYQVWETLKKLKPLQNKKGQKIWGTREKSSIFPYKRTAFFLGTPNFFVPSYFEAALVFGRLAKKYAWVQNRSSCLWSYDFCNFPFVQLQYKFQKAYDHDHSQEFCLSPTKMCVFSRQNT